jgi:hypothetical protein
MLFINLLWEQGCGSGFDPDLETSMDPDPGGLKKEANEARKCTFNYFFVASVSAVQFWNSGMFLYFALGRTVILPSRS